MSKLQYKFNKFSKLAIITTLLSLCMNSSQAQLLNLKSQNTFPSTSNDGVTPDKYISYIELNGSSGISIPLNDVGLNTKLSYTLMLWMKPLDSNFGKQYQYAVQFDDSLQCYFSGTEQLMCDSDSLGTKLKVSTSGMKQNQWTHMTVAGSASTSTYLQLDQNGRGVIASNTASYLNLQQKYTPWRACLGSCSSDYVFIGGLREFKFFTTYINSTQASVLRNHYMLWDTSMLAYYRFTEADVLGNEIFTKNGQITSDTYKIQRDYSVNDICYPINNYLQLYKFKTDNDFQTMYLDGRYAPPTSNWGYTLSSWIQLNSSSCYQSNPTLARQNCYILLLEGAFMIFSPAPNQIAAYIFNQKAYYQYQTKSIFVPNNQWFNLQFVASQYTGYEFRIYDILGRLMGTTTESRNLQEQVIQTKQLKVFSQFKGLVKNLILYLSKKSLPINFPYVDFTAADPNIINNDCLLYIEFQAGFVTQSSTLQMKNICRHYTYGMMHLNFNNIDDNYVGQYWKTFVTPTNDGLISSSSKFDGVACEDNDTVLEMKKSTSTISTTTVKAITSAPNVTIEFWFKTQVPVISTFYLMSLWGRVRSVQYFSIYYEGALNKKLICAPFGYLSSSQPTVAFESFTDTNRQTKSGWFHLACQYEQSKELVGYLYNANNVDDRVVTSLTSSNLVMQPDTYDIYVGNDASLSSSTVGTRFKEVRFWASKRTQSDIKYWRFRQIDPKIYTTDVLLIYLRLNEGSFKEYNAAQLINDQLTYPVVAFQDVQYESDSTITICPTSTFLSTADNQCYLDPVQYTEGGIYPVYDSTSSTLYWLFSGDESIMMDSSVAGQIRSNWIFDDDNTNKIIAKNTQYKNGIDIKVPSSIFKDGSLYNVRLNYSNSDLSFVEYKDMKFVPKSCMYYIMSGSNSYQSYLNYTQTQSKYDLTFTMTPVTLKSYCNDISFYNTLQNAFTYRFSPPLSSQPALTFVINQDQTVTITIPAKEQSKFPLQQNISIIFDLNYENSFYVQQGVVTSSSKIFQNVKQTIFFNLIGQTMTATLSSNSTSVYNKQGVILSAKSTISNSESNDYNRLTYTWICPQFIKSQCPTTNSTTFTLTNNQFTSNSGVYSTPYTFQVNVTYTDSMGTLMFDLKSIQIQWINLDSPEFKITAPSPVLASADSQSFLLKFDSYPTTAEIPASISIAWSIVPNISSTLYTITNSSTNLTVRANAFQFYTAYIVSAIVTNQNGQNSLTKYQQTTFTISTPPTGGTVNISPFIGYVGETTLTVSILNWQSTNKPISYRVWSTSNSGGTVVNKVISADWTQDSQTFKFIPTDTNPYQIQITDLSGEYTWVKNTPAITIRQTNNAAVQTLIQQQQKLQIILETQSITDKYDSLTQFASTELNTTSTDQTNSTQSANNDTSSVIIAKTQSKIAIVDSIQSDTTKILEQLKSESDSSIVSKGALKVLNVILDDQNTLTTELVQKTVDVIRSILSQDENVVSSLLRDQTFLTNFANSISSLMQYGDQQSVKGRLLQQDFVATLSDQTRQLKAVLEDQLCSDSIQNQGSQQIATTAFNLVVQKLTFDTPFKSTTLRYLDDQVSGITFNTLKMSDSLKQASTSILDTYCIMSTFIKTANSVTNSTLKQKYSPQVVEYEIQNVRTKQTYDPTIYTPQDNVQLEFQVQPSTFKNNQTICMSYQSLEKQWSGDSCITTIDAQRNSLKCQCTVIDSNQYALINDYSRMLGPEIQFSLVPSTDEPNSGIIDKQSTTQVEQTYVFFILVSLLLVIMFGLPVLSIILDKRDQKAQTQKEISKNTFKIMERLSKLTNKPLNYWTMRNIEVQESILNSKSQISLVLQEIHPLINILSKYSIEQPRIYRFATYFLQIALYTLIVNLAFNPNYRQEDSSRIEDGLDQQDIRNVIGYGILGMFMLIPFQMMTRCFERKVENLQNQKDISLRLGYLQENNFMNEQQNNQQSPNNILYTNQKIFQKNMSQTGESQRPVLQIIDEQQNQELKISQKCRALYVIILVIGYLLAVTAIGLCFIYAPQMPVSNQYCMIASFYIGLIGSLTITNLVRVLLNSLLVSTYDRSSKCQKIFLRFILAKETIEMYKTQKLVQEAINMKENSLQLVIPKSPDANQESLKIQNTTTKILNNDHYSIQRGTTIDATKLSLQFKNQLIQDEEHDNDVQNESLGFDQIEQINDYSLQNKSLSPGQFRTSEVQIDVEEISCNLNSSVDVRTISQESFNMKSIDPMTQSVVDFNKGSMGLFGSTLKKDGILKLNNLNHTNQIRSSKIMSPKQQKSPMIRRHSGSGEIKKYSQIMMQNQSHNEDLMNCDDSNRVQLP